jgi:hypothetical protein
MADYCPHCFEKLDALHLCDDTINKQSSKSAGSELWHTNQSFSSTLVFAPLGGILLDFLLPIPSSILNSAFLAIMGSALVGIIWIAFKYQGQKSLRFYLINLKNFIFTPNLLKILGGFGKKGVITTWVGMIVISAVLQIILFTPGNSNYLANRVTTKIDDASGANLSVECPSLKFFFYNERIECRVKTGLLGITVPARAKLSPIFGNSEIKVSLF